MVNELLIIVVLVLINGLLAMAEVAILSSRRSRLESMAKKGSTGAKIALDMASKPARYLSAVQVGISLFGILTGIFAGKSLMTSVTHLLLDSGVEEIFAGYIAFISVVLVISFISLLFGEVLPKRIGLHKPETIGTILSPLMSAFSRLTSPLIWILTTFTDGILRIFGIRSNGDETQVTEEEVIEFIAQGTNSGTIDEVEQDMMERVLLLGDRSVASLMTNRIEMEWLDINESLEKNLEKVILSNHSMFPVCDHEIDKILGILSSKKLLELFREKSKSDMKSLLAPLKVIPENMRALTALEDFKLNNTKMAIVVDEFGSVQGIITQSDLFEAIIAEHDTPDDENEISIIKRNENSYLIDALLPFEEFLQYFEIEEVDPSDKAGFHSLGGFILHLSKQIPSTGDRFSWKNYEFEVVDMDGNRIDKLLITIKEDMQEE
ncbi:MAG TPA: hemolysin family protein [Catalimonadaceae bacterium]|nr:hemolysin family protein [Catalimonadaceae bacterium]